MLSCLNMQAFEIFHDIEIKKKMVWENLCKIIASIFINVRDFLTFFVTILAFINHKCFCLKVNKHKATLMFLRIWYSSSISSTRLKIGGIPSPSNFFFRDSSTRTPEENRTLRVSLEMVQSFLYIWRVFIIVWKKKVVRKTARKK